MEGGDLLLSVPNLPSRLQAVQVVLYGWLESHAQRVADQCMTDTHFVERRELLCKIIEVF